MYRKRRSKSRSRRRKTKIFIFLILTIIVLGFIFIAVFGIKSLFFSSKNSQYDNIITIIARQYSIDPLLVKAVIWRESDFNPNAVGTKGEIGLMQLMMKSSVKDWATHKKRREPERGVVFNPWLNIEIGTWYLAWCRQQWRGYGNKEALALATYNAGYSNVKKWIPEKYQGNIIELIKFPSTKNYVLSIMKKYQLYKKTESK